METNVPLLFMLMITRLVSHKDPQVVTRVMNLMKKHFRELKVVRGNKHLFLGMNIEIMNEKKVLST